MADGLDKAPVTQALCHTSYRAFVCHEAMESRWLRQRSRKSQARRGTSSGVSQHPLSCQIGALGSAANSDASQPESRAHMHVNDVPRTGACALGACANRSRRTSPMA